MTFHFEKSVTIQAPPVLVWETITLPRLMKQWMGEPELQLTVQTNWKVNSEIIITGFHHLPFENKGRVLAVEPERLLRYNQLSSLSKQPDLPENYSIFEFNLQPQNDKTVLSLTITNFPTETIYRHLQFYWQTTLLLIKKFIEENQDK